MSVNLTLFSYVSWLAIVKSVFAYYFMSLGGVRVCLYTFLHACRDVCEVMHVCMVSLHSLLLIKPPSLLLES